MSSKKRKPVSKINSGESSQESNPQSKETAKPVPPVISYRRIIIRTVLIIGSMILVRYYTEKDGLESFAPTKPLSRKLVADIPCSKDYDDDRKKFTECAPKKCGRIVMDNVVSEEEAKNMLEIAKKGLLRGGSSGGASILDLHSGALSQGEQFVNIYKLMEREKILTENDFKTYTNVKNKIRNAIAQHFEIPVSSLYLTKPTFFSRMIDRPAKTIHDEYWHPHIDKKTYGSFHYTSLLYLSTYQTNFKGGRFVFVDKQVNRTVEPLMGRLSFFTSGSENVHFVEKVTEGTRYAVTVSFTCDPSQAISDPKL